MYEMLRQITKARKLLLKENIICITSDTDWASDYAIQTTFQFFESYDIPVTAFITNESAAIRAYMSAGKIKCGIHPNFMQGSSQGNTYDEVIDFCFQLLPDAKYFRAHRYYDVNDTIEKLKARGIFWESNVCSLMDIVPPFLHRSKTISFPVFWEDGAFLYYMEDFHFPFMEKQLLQPGLKVLNIHPMHFMLNTPYFSYTREIKDRLSREEWNSMDESVIGKLAFSGEGITTYIENIMKTIRKHGITTMYLDDVYEWIISL